MSLDAFDAFVCVDTGTWSQLPGLKERVVDWHKPKLVIDHHLTQEDWADVKLVVTEAAAAGEIARSCSSVGREDRRADRVALYVAIASDTGWFQFSNTRPFTMRLAATLMEAGVDTDRMYQLLYQNERAERVALQTRALQSLELLQGRPARRDAHPQGATSSETGANVPDTENLINIPLQIAHRRGLAPVRPSRRTSARSASACGARGRWTSPDSPNNSAAAATPARRG